jgi:hypothetical protein
MIRPGVRIGDVARGDRDGEGVRHEEWFYFRGHGIGATTHIRRASCREQRILEQTTFAYEPMFVRKNFGTACVEDLYWSSHRVRAAVRGA